MPAASSTRPAAPSTSPPSTSKAARSPGLSRTGASSTTPAATFSGRLLNYGTANLYAGGNTSFTAGNGLLQNSATPLCHRRGPEPHPERPGADRRGQHHDPGRGILNATDEIIGDIGTGAVFTQTGGTNTASGALTLANNLGSSGTYNLQGGSLSADTFNLNAGGTFTQTGGTFHFNHINLNGGIFNFSDFYLGQAAGSSNTYNLDSGTLTAANEYIGFSGTGVFTQSGGTNTVSNTLTLAANPGSSGTYNLQGGSLSAATVNLNAGGTFTQTGGTFDFTTFNHNAGSASFADLYLGSNAGSSSTYNLSGGSLSAVN